MERWIRFRYRNEIGGRSINYLRYTDDTTSIVEISSDLKLLLMKVKDERVEIVLQLNDKKIKIWITEELHYFNINIEKNVIEDFLNLGSIINTYGAKKSEELRCESLALKEFESILNNKTVSLEINLFICTLCLFPVTMYGSENWTVRTDKKKLDLWCYQKALITQCQKDK